MMELLRVYLRKRTQIRIFVTFLIYLHFTIIKVIYDEGRYGRNWEKISRYVAGTQRPGP